MRKTWSIVGLMFMIGLAGCTTSEFAEGDDCFPGTCAAYMDLSVQGTLPGVVELVATFVPKVGSDAYANNFYAGIWIPESLSTLNGSVEYRGPVRVGERITLYANVTGSTAVHEVRTFATFTETDVGAPSATEVRVFELHPDLVIPKATTATDVTASVGFPNATSFEVQIVPKIAVNYSVDVVASTDFAIDGGNTTGYASGPTLVSRASVLPREGLQNGQHHVAFVMVDVSPYASPSRIEISIAAIIEDSKVVRLIEGRTPETMTDAGNRIPESTTN